MPNYSMEEKCLGNIDLRILLFSEQTSKLILLINLFNSIYQNDNNSFYE